MFDAKFERQEKIFWALDEFYGGSGLNKPLAQHLEDMLCSDGVYIGRKPTRQGFINLIWMYYPGGGAAEACGTHILNVIGVNLDDDD